MHHGVYEFYIPSCRSLVTVVPSLWLCAIALGFIKFVDSVVHAYNYYNMYVYMGVNKVIILLTIYCTVFTPILIIRIKTLLHLLAYLLYE